MTQDAISTVAAGLRARIQAGTVAYGGLEQARISSSLFHLLPELPIEAHDALIADILLHQHLAAAEPQHWAEIYPGLQAEGPGLALARGAEPAIFCSFHYGSYRLVLPWLLETKGAVTMLIDRSVAAGQGEGFQQKVAEFARVRGNAGDLIIRDTSDGQVVLRLLRDLRQGRSLLLFVDANLGTQPAAVTADGEPSPHEAAVDFLGARLWTRTGASVLSCLGQRPIVPLLPLREAPGQARVRLQCFAPIQPGPDRHAHAVPSMQALWQVLEQALRRDPAPWECWRYVDRSLDPRSLTRLLPGSEPGDLAARTWRLHSQRYLLETGWSTTRVLFDRCLMRSFLISGALADTLERLRGAATPGAELLGWPGLNRATLTGFVQRGLLVDAGPA